MLTVRLNELAGGNAAFQEDANGEVCRILRDIASKIENGQCAGICRDSNGNTAGRWDYCPPEVEEEEGADPK